MGDRLDRWADPPLLVLASLADEPKHGYAITQDVAETMGVRLSAGTLYAVISRLEARGLIEPLPSEDRRRPYRLTAAGATELARQSQRMSKVASLATRRLRPTWAGPEHEGPRHATADDAAGPCGARPVPAVLAGPVRRRGARAAGADRRRAARRGQPGLARAAGLDWPPPPCAWPPPRAARSAPPGPPCAALGGHA